MSVNPLVSVGIVTRNRGHLISAALDQIIGQTYKHLEIIISDNSSTDNTEEICKKYAKKDARIVYYRQKENIGMYNNFNFVLQKAKGEYFLWATDDDEWNSNFIERMMALHQRHPQVGVATSNYVLFSDNYSETTHYSYAESLAPPKSVEIFLYHAVFITYGVVKTSLLRKAGGFFRYPWPIPDGIGDSVINLRILLQAGVAFDQEILWRKRDSGYTFEKFELLSTLATNPVVCSRICRYLLFPILFLYNLIFMSRDVLTSRTRFFKKIKLLRLVFGFYIIANIEYITNIFLGVFALLRTLTKLLSNLF